MYSIFNHLKLRSLLIWLSAIGCLFLNSSTVVKKPRKPNIILILADDMGFSDIGCYGSEIPTPYLDSLAGSGVRYTQFYNTARCSPTRASLLTGLHPHQAGVGRLAEEIVARETNKLPTTNEEGYLGYLNTSCITLAEALKPAGYKTYMAGKWHVGSRIESRWPLQRGFDRFYGILSGATSYFKPSHPRELTLDNTQLEAPTDSNYYTTDAFTNFAIQTIKDHSENSPFFLYLAFNAPHWPLQARKDDIKQFVGKYRAGWDSMRVERLNRQKKLGIIAPGVQLTARDECVRPWDQLSEEQKTNLDYRMAVYAAQVSRMDWNVGRLITALKDKEELDNTLIIFLSDNGACAEPYTDLGGGSQDKINDPSVSFNVSYGTGWANLSNTPFRKFKSMLHEGGISTPLIIHWPAGLHAKGGSLNKTPTSIIDIMPTLLAVSGAKYPDSYKGQQLVPLQGHSLLPMAKTNKSGARTFYWEQYGYKAIRVGDWKAVFTAKNMYDKTGTGVWELYDLSNDRTEMHDVSADNSDRLAAMVKKWNDWAAASHVFPAPHKPGLKN